MKVQNKIQTPKKYIIFVGSSALVFISAMSGVCSPDIKQRKDGKPCNIKAKPPLCTSVSGGQTPDTAQRIWGK